MHKIPDKYLRLVISGMILLSLLNLNSPKIYFGDEAYYLDAGIHMVKSGHWLTPVHEGEVRFQKPVFFYWLVALSYRIFGISMFAGRLPSLLGMAFLAIIIWRLTDLLFESNNAGFYSAIVFLSTPMTIWYGRTAMTDMMLSLFLIGGFYFGILGFIKDDNRRMNFAISFVFMGLGTITKGMAGFLFPLLSLLLCSIFFREWRILLKSFLHPLNWLIFFVIALPWPVAMYYIHGNKFISHILNVEITGRFSLSLMKIIQAIFYYSVVLLRYSFPWILLLPIALVCNRGIWRETWRTSRKSIMTILVFSGILFFSYSILITDIRARYLLPVIPMSSVLTGVVISKPEQWLSEKVLARIIIVAVIFISALVIVFSISGIYIVSKTSGFSSLPFIATLALSVAGIIASLFAFHRLHFQGYITAICIFILLIVNVMLGWTIPNVSPSPVHQLAKKINRKANQADIYGFLLSDGESTILKVTLKREIRNFSPYDVDTVSKLDKASSNTFVILKEKDFTHHIEGGYKVISRAFGFERIDAGRFWNSIQNGKVNEYLESCKIYYILIQGVN